MTPRPFAVFAACILVTASLSACGADSAAPAAAPVASPSASAAPGAALSVTDPWAKAADAGEMTAAFGTLVNHTDATLTVVSAASPLASAVELHEVVEEHGETSMRRKEGGLVIPPSGTHQLAPGGDHLMLMKLTRAAEPGMEIPLTLTLADGTTVEFTATVKEFSGANEDYRPGEHDAQDGHGGKRDDEHDAQGDHDGKRDGEHG